MRDARRADLPDPRPLRVRRRRRGGARCAASSRTSPGSATSSGGRARTAGCSATRSSVARLGTWEWNTATGECIWSSMLYELFARRAGHPDHLHRLPEPRAPGRPRLGRRALARARHQRPAGRGRAPGDPAGRHAAGVPLPRRRAGPATATIMIGTAQDVTEQRSTETRMMRSSQRFTDLVAIAPVGIGLFDETERLVDANEALCRLLEMDLERLRGSQRGAADAPHRPRQAAAHHARRRPGARGGSPPTCGPGSGCWSPRRARPVYCELGVTESVADDGQRFWLVVFSDVTDRRRAAERLRYQATHDELTGLPGRAAVNELLGQLLGGPDADQRRAAVVRRRQLQAGQRLARPRRRRRADHRAGPAARARACRRRARRPGCPATSTWSSARTWRRSAASRRWRTGWRSCCAPRCRCAASCCGCRRRSAPRCRAARTPRPRTCCASPTPRCSTPSGRAPAGCRWPTPS